MFLGVCLHASVSYMPGRMPGLVWVIHDRHTHPAFGVLFWGLHSFRLPLFFFLAGFFAALVEQTRGPAGLLAHRVRRLLVPFLVGCVVLLPLTFYVWAAGWLVGGRCIPKEILAVKFAPPLQRELYGPLHLWFLEDLFLLTLALCAVRWIGRRRDPRAPGPHRPWLFLSLPLVLSVPTTAVLAGSLAPVLEHHNSFVPDLWRLLHYGVFFAAGVALYRRGDRLHQVFRFWPAHLALTVPAAAAVFVLLPRVLAGEGWETRLALAGALALVAWLSLFGLLGLAVCRWNAERPLLRYLADAAYWVYLCHLPLVGLVQLDLEGTTLPAGLEFLLVVSLTALVSLGSYHTLVRHTFVGAWLHGPRRRAPDPAPRVPARRAA
jgi:peptidoglycan/LPS O-acetylase OafA/YrhL